MKKNLISILILALLIVNIVLTAIMMISVTGAAKKTSALVGDIASILNLELTTAVGEEAVTEAVPIKDTDVYKIEDQMTVPFKTGEDGKSHFCMVSVSLSQNVKDKDYKEYGGATNMASKEDLIKAKIVDVIGSFTMEEAQSEAIDLQEEILKAVQEMFDSKFVFQVVFRDVVFQ